MKVSLNWLREYVDVPDDVAALSELLTLAGVEVEGIETHGIASDLVVTARIESFAPHPDADRLSVCRVNDGGAELRQIVCGAKNFQAGDVVPLALPGAVLPGNFTIKVGKLRGVESQGMLCAAKEIGLSDGEDGLMILPADLPIGQPLREIFGADTVLEVEVTPNRPDLLSHLGMAREIAALSQKTLRLPEIPELEYRTGDPTVTLRDETGCPYYIARRIEGVKIAPSPLWLRRKLEAIGLRAINNVADITNLVMFELGQPLHAFDAARVSGGIVVRAAEAEEKIEALDGAEYTLRPSDLVIADADRALAIAGVMGGTASSITAETTTVILESAWFEPRRIRRSSRELGVSSDSSYRFERRVDPAGVDRASRRATRLILEIAGGTLAATTVAGSVPVAEISRVTLRPGRCSAVAGSTISETEAARTLTALGLESTGPSGEEWIIPSYRPDLTREMDLIEEVIRVFGIERIPPRLRGTYVSSSTADATHDRALEIRRLLAARGFFECRNVSLISAAEADADPMRETALVPLKNPMSEDQTILRPHLAPGLLRVLAHNLRAGTKSIRLFEIGRTFQKNDSEESLHLGLVWSGSWNPASWRDKDPRAAEFQDLKEILGVLGLPELRFSSLDCPELPLAAEIRALGRVVGRIGQLAPSAARGLDATSPVLLAEVDLSALFSAKVRLPRFREIVKFPAISRDIAFIAPAAVTHEAIEKALRAPKEPLLQSVELFDVFTDPTGERVPLGQRSLAYTLTYRADDRTLTTDEVTQAHGRLKASLRAATEVEFRE